MAASEHNAMEIFAVKWNIVSDSSKVLLNDIFAELDGSSGIKSIITDRLAKSFRSWWIASRWYINKNYSRKYEEIISMR